MSNWYPLLLDMKGRLCLVVGGGQVAARKVKSLLGSGAKVRIVSPEICQEIEGVESPMLELIRASYENDQMDGVALVVAATSSETVNISICEEANKRGIFVNVVDQPQSCTFIVPSVVRRGDLILSISTSGASPAVSKKLRRDLEKEFGEEWSVYLKMMGQARKLAHEHVDDQKSREKVFNNLVESELLELVRGGELKKAEELVREIVGL